MTEFKRKAIEIAKEIKIHEINCKNLDDKFKYFINELDYLYILLSKQNLKVELYELVEELLEYCDTEWCIYNKLLEIQKIL